MIQQVETVHYASTTPYRNALQTLLPSINNNKKYIYSITKIKQQIIVLCYEIPWPTSTKGKADLHYIIEEKLD